MALSSGLCDKTPAESFLNLALPNPLRVLTNGSLRHGAHSAAVAFPIPALLVNLCGPPKTFTPYMTSEVPVTVALH